MYCLGAAMVMVVVTWSEVEAELGSVYKSFFFLRIMIVLLVTIYDYTQ